MNFIMVDSFKEDLIHNKELRLFKYQLGRNVYDINSFTINDFDRDIKTNINDVNVTINQPNILIRLDDTRADDNQTLYLIYEADNVYKLGFVTKIKDNNWGSSITLHLNLDLSNYIIISKLTNIGTPLTDRHYHDLGAFDQNYTMIKPVELISKIKNKVNMRISTPITGSSISGLHFTPLQGISESNSTQSNVNPITIKSTYIGGSIGSEVRNQVRENEHYTLGGHHIRLLGQKLDSIPSDNQELINILSIDNPDDKLNRKMWYLTSDNLRILVKMLGTLPPHSSLLSGNELTNILLENGDHVHINLGKLRDFISTLLPEGAVYTQPYDGLIPSNIWLSTDFTLMNILRPNIGNLGEIIFSTNNQELNNPSILEVKGQTVSRSDYYEFSDYLESNPIEGFILSGDSIILPDWTNQFIRGLNARSVGNIQQAIIMNHSHNTGGAAWKPGTAASDKRFAVQSPIQPTLIQLSGDNRPINIATRLGIRVKPAMGTIWKSLGASKVDFFTLWVGVRHSSQFIINLDKPSIFCMVEFTIDNLLKIFFIDSEGTRVFSGVPNISDVYVNPNNFTGSTLIANIDFPILVDNEFIVINTEITFELIERGNIRLTINNDVIILTSTGISENKYLSDYSIPVEGIGLDAFNVSNVKVQLEFIQYFNEFTFIKLKYIDEYGLPIPLNNTLLGNVSNINEGIAGVVSKTSLNVISKGVGVLSNEEFDLNLSFNGNTIFSNELLGVDKYQLAEEYNTWSSLHYSSSINVVGLSEEGFQFRSISYIIENENLFLINEFGQKLTNSYINGSSYELTQGVLDKLLPSVLSNKNRARLLPPNFPSTSAQENITLIKNNDMTITFNTSYFNGTEILKPIGGKINWDGFYISKSFDNISGINPEHDLPITKNYLVLTIDSGLLSMFFVDDYGIRLDFIKQNDNINEIYSDIIEFENMIYDYINSISFKIKFPATSITELEQIIFTRNPNFYSMQSFITPVDRYGEFTKDPELVIWEDSFTSKYEESFLGYNTTDSRIMITKRRLVIEFNTFTDEDEEDENILSMYYVDEYGNSILSFESNRQAIIEYTPARFKFIQGTLNTTGGKGLFIIENHVTDNIKLNYIKAKAWVSNNKFILFRYISTGHYYIEDAIKKDFSIKNNQLILNNIPTSSFMITENSLNINGVIYDQVEVPNREDLFEILKNGTWIWNFDNMIETYLFFENGLGSVGGIPFNWDCIDGYFYKNDRLNEDLRKVTFTLANDCTSITLGTKQCVSDFYQPIPLPSEEYFTFNYTNDEGSLSLSNSNLESFNTFAKG